MLFNIEPLKKQVASLEKQVQCLLASAPSATRWSPDHSETTGNKYEVDTRVWHDGYIYKCLVANNGSDINNSYFWCKIGKGHLLEEAQSDWLATGGAAFIRNKPFGLGGEETDPVFSAWLLTNPLEDYLTQPQTDLLYYPLSANPLGYLTQEEVLEYESLLDIQTAHPAGTTGTVYIATNILTTGVPVYYIWNGVAYVTTTQPVTGVTGSGIVGTHAVWTSPTTLGNSRLVDGANGGVYTFGSQWINLINGGSVLTLNRSQSSMNFQLGVQNALVTQILSTQAVEGLELASVGDLTLSSGGVTPVSRLHISRTTGNVHIGGSPYAAGSDKLQVTGDLRLTGAFKDSTNSAGTSGQILSSTATGTNWIDTSTIVSSYLPLAGGTMSGAIEQPIAPVNAFDLINKNYFDNAITGLTWKTEVKCSTTANHPLSGTSNVDGVTVPAGTRVLVRFQTLPEQNGIYISAAGAWSRATDADNATEVEASTVLVRSGTLYKNTQWTQSSVVNVLGTDAVTYVQVSGAGTYVNGSGLTLTGNAFSIGALQVVNSMINDVAWSKITGAPSLTLQNIVNNGNTTDTDIVFTDLAGVVFTNSFNGVIDGSLITNDQFWQMPDASGVVALTSDIISPLTILTTTITNGDTTHAPDGNTIYNALALKQPLVENCFMNHYPAVSNPLICTPTQ